ncbi:MAG: hypothetical protein H7176_03025 [Bdellovibrionales bacterium]|nr:hypothetical protein [Massilia sp.]
MNIQSTPEMDIFIKDAYVRKLTIVETIKLVRERFQISLAQAKDVVSNHPSWQLVVEASAPLKSEIERALSTELGKEQL